MVSGVEGQDFELDAVWVVILQGDVFQVTLTGAAHVRSGMTKGMWCLLFVQRKQKKKKNPLVLIPHCWDNQE